MTHSSKRHLATRIVFLCTLMLPVAGFAMQFEWQQFTDVGTNDPFFGHLDDYGLTTLNALYRF